ncbi:ParB/Srx family N-terminal domain-containing protein [Bradyrhizobium sp. CB3481]|uniref:ParB/Srx family N-terminal domain-containing protein n=1 Tax=Bradyrhizobium sp. CB3481 TaxID=3039158 RepID=UPI0024B2735B|nr:ParB/Srx family N-terminal domain-containing protein [Bradyrhizobium sp. CB3481]WFU14426.1 ParB/Srx family N-terminal domain-containing protein [Bradyrhizobium sp. CB3481]
MNADAEAICCFGCERLLASHACGLRYESPTYSGHKRASHGCPSRHAAIEVWPIDRLCPYERNSRRHTPGIAASIREWGWTMPILAVDDGMVLAGHGRLQAAKLLWIAEVPVIVARGWPCR